MAVQGLQTTLKALRTYSTTVQEKVKDSVEQVTIDIEREAMRKAPASKKPIKTKYGFQKNTTGINQYIYSKIKNNGFTGEVGVEAGASKMAAYLEFGTGSSAAVYVPSLPVEWQQIARTYYINGKGTILAQPFLLPSYFEKAPNLNKKIRAILKNTKL